jgi:hypothetical protein
VKWRPRHAWATVSLLVGMFIAPASSAAAVTPGTVSLRDSRINESSALVDYGSSWVTTNDSGDTARVFLVSPATGATVGVSYFHANVVDVEALAPADRTHVWVGDIGDNDGERKSISVFRVAVGRGRIDVHPPAYRLVYPKGRPNAESLFADRQGRLHLITKNVGGGVVYRAPAKLSATRPNRLVAVGNVAQFATDAALSRDGRHVIVRGPELAGVYSVPGFQRVGGFELPPQPQGEGISVGPDGAVRVSSEGVHTAVRRVALPAAVQATLDPPAAPTPTPSASPSASASPSPSPSPSPSSSPSATPGATSGASPSTTSTAREKSSGGLGDIDPPWLMWCIPGVVALGALGIGIGLRRKTE